MGPYTYSYDAPEALVDALPRNVLWMVKEPVMVLWEEAEPHQEAEKESEEESESRPEVEFRRTRLRSLGQPSATDKYPNVTLWIGRGCNEADRDMHRREDKGEEEGESEDKGDEESEDKGQEDSEDEDENTDKNMGRYDSERQPDTHDKGREEMIVLLQMTFHIKVSSGNRKKAFDMFCVLPSADFLMPRDEKDSNGNFSPNFSPLSMHHLSPSVYDCLKDAEPSRRLIHVRFCAQQASRVLMHHRPHVAKHVTGTPLHLMLLLQSLSRTLTFDAYLSYSTYAAECLKTVATRLDLGVTLPAIDLNRVFGGVGGCFDHWEQFNPEHFAPRRESHLLVAQQSHLLAAQQCPPGYDYDYDYSDPTRDIAATRKRRRPCSSSTNSPPRHVQSKHDKLRDTQAEKVSHVPRISPPTYVRQQPDSTHHLAISPSPPALPPRYVQSKHDKHDKLQDTLPGKVSHVPRIPPPSYVRQQPHLSHHPAFSPSSPALPPTPLALPPTPLVLPPTPLAFPPSATTSSITHPPTILVAASESHTSPDRTTVDFSDCVPDTPLDIVCTPDAAYYTTTPCAASPPITISPPAASSSSPEPSASIPSPPLVSALTCLFTSCILDMNSLSPDFYTLPRFHVLLLSLATAATSGSKIDFIQAKAKATTSVLLLARTKHLPDERHRDKDTHQIITLNLLHELDLLLQWMYTHDLDATGAEPGYKYGDGPLLTALRQMAAWAAAYRRTLKACAEIRYLVKEMGDQPSHAEKPKAKIELNPDDLIQGFRRWQGECVAQFYLSLVAKAGRPL